MRRVCLDPIIRSDTNMVDDWSEALEGLEAGSITRSGRWEVDTESCSAAEALKVELCKIGS